MDRQLISTSKFLSLILRHRPETVGLQLDSDGWVNISELITAAAASGKQLDHDLLLRVMYENDKQRFAISDDGHRIRANQGHSVSVNLGLKPRTPPETLYHGTVERFINSIREQGIISGARQYVHLSADTLTSSIVGQRRGKPIVLLVLAQKMADAGNPFFLSQNGVWLTGHVPPNFIRFPGS